MRTMSLDNSVCGDTGIALFAVVPSPSWPYVLSPQQVTELVLVSNAQALRDWCDIAMMAASLIPLTFHG